jgi:hypothetical protein
MKVELGKVSQISGCQSLIQCLVFSHLIFLSSHFPSRDSSYPLQAFSPLCHVQSFLIICFGSLLIWRWEKNNNKDFFSRLIVPLFCMCVHLQGLCDLKVKNNDNENSFSPCFFFLLCVCVFVHTCVCRFVIWIWRWKSCNMYVCVCACAHARVCVKILCVWG